MHVTYHAHAHCTDNETLCSVFFETSAHIFDMLAYESKMIIIPLNNNKRHNVF